jgi:hypothetical protein
MITRLSILCTLVSTLGGAASAPTGPADRATVLLRQRLDDGAEIAVAVCPTGDVQAVAGLVNAKNWIAPPTYAYCLQLRLLARAHTPAVLWSSVHLATHATDVRQVEAFDLVRYQGRIIIAEASSGIIHLWRVDLSTASAERYTLHGVDWTRFAALTPIDRKSVSVNLGHTESGMVTARVEDLRGNFKQVTVFVQQAGQWKFSVDRPDRNVPRGNNGQDKPTLRRTPETQRAGASTK